MSLPYVINFSGVHIDQFEVNQISKNRPLHVIIVSFHLFLSCWGNALFGITSIFKDFGIRPV